MSTAAQPRTIGIIRYPCVRKDQYQFCLLWVDKENVNGVPVRGQMFCANPSNYRNVKWRNTNESGFEAAIEKAKKELEDSLK